MSLLEIKGLTKQFGGLVAVNDLSLSIDKGQILGLIGPNGAGKSTAFNCVAGVYAPTQGQIIFDGEDVTGQNPWDLCKKGMGRTFQIVKPFASQTVLENVMVGAFATTDNRDKAETRAADVLDMLGMGDKKDLKPGALTIADRKCLEIAKALATNPKLLLLDEVMAGLRPTEVDEVIQIIQKLKSKGMTIFVIEHIMRAIMALSDEIVVIQFGKKICQGEPEMVARDKNVIKAYLGEDYASA
ncbi:ABC transporter ATP-binding protein [Pseudodesulfovibrio piezophilus]|uniref:High-affinity branched-chain amino acid transport ATP-binding protein BraF n=1 Tax=Pseudodesulfovibrio piezophilus (strain DSM 21447 / JCM 15486 / C1TLV30) TaxID=1322246 RepID=M1WSH6_PSEP2|nr:ABC transporter ATP-binding protein [Pseudodesulfovibrio piezophilus]CCH50204.1 High-affinity branched-chain amino acid transport ATP-binding protein BraF [Pseudodesulfovibrio piezophilus C1TLV30]